LATASSGTISPYRRGRPTAISRFASHLDPFVSGRDGGIYSTFWDGSTGWSNRWFRLGRCPLRDGFTIPPGARVTAQSRDPNIIDLFVTGRDTVSIRRSDRPGRLVWPVVWPVDERRDRLNVAYGQGEGHTVVTLLGQLRRQRIPRIR
jgi:hypothetical protein